jgi:hypothetical protein
VRQSLLANLTLGTKRVLLAPIAGAIWVMAWAPRVLEPSAVITLLPCFKLYKNLLVLFTLSTLFVIATVAAVEPTSLFG